MLTMTLMTMLGSALVLSTLYIGAVLIWYLLLALGRWQMFEKMGQPGWKGFIPIYSDYVLYGSCWQTAFFWVALAASAICAFAGADSQSAFVSLAGIVGGVLEAFLALRISRSFGHGVLFAVGLMLAEPLFILYLGFGPDRYYRLNWGNQPDLRCIHMHLCEGRWISGASLFSAV